MDTPSHNKGNFFKVSKKNVQTLITKEFARYERNSKYASNPDIDTAQSKYNFHIVQPQAHYRQEVDSRIETAGCRTRKDSVGFIDTLITASPDFFKGKKYAEVKAYFERATDFLSRKISKGNIFTAVVHMDEKTPHMHLCFTPITEDGRLSAKDIIGNRVQLTEWQDDFWAHMVKGFPELERGESASKTGRKHMRLYPATNNLICFLNASTKIYAVKEDCLNLLIQ